MAAGALAPRGALVYAGFQIRDRGEMLNLTDMWKAAGSDVAQQPANWLASVEGRRFVAAFSGADNPSETGIIEARRGRNGGTFAHWQIGLAYAKYLSPEFHMWCNSVVRAHMEGRGLRPHVAVPAVVSITEDSLHRLAYIAGQAAGEAVAAKFSEVVEAKIDASNARIEARLERLEQATPERRRRPSQTVLKDLFAAAHALGDRCPCCGLNHVTSPVDGSRAVGVEVDHFFRASHADAEHCWPICRSCHADLTTGRMSRTDAERQFHAFQSRRQRVPGGQARLFW